MSGKLELSKALLRAAHDRDGLTEEETLRIGQDHGLSLPQSAALQEVLGDHYVSPWEESLLLGQGRWNSVTPGGKALIGAFRGQSSAVGLLRGTDGLGLFRERFRFQSEPITSDEPANLAAAFTNLASLYGQLRTDYENERVSSQQDETSYFNGVFHCYKDASDEFPELLTSALSTIRIGGDPQATDAALEFISQVKYYPLSLNESTALIEDLSDILALASPKTQGKIAVILANLLAEDSRPLFNLVERPEIGSLDEKLWSVHPEMTWWRMMDRAVDALTQAYEDMNAELEMEASQGVGDPATDFDDTDLAGDDPRVIALGEIADTLEAILAERARK